MEDNTKDNNIPNKEDAEIRRLLAEAKKFEAEEFEIRNRTKSIFSPKNIIQAVVAGIITGLIFVASWIGFYSDIVKKETELAAIENSIIKSKNIADSLRNHKSRKNLRDSLDEHKDRLVQFMNKESELITQNAKLIEDLKGLAHDYDLLSKKFTDSLRYQFKKKQSSLIERANNIEDPLANNNDEYFALIIGVDDYLDTEFHDLNYPSRDAINLQTILMNQYGFKEKNTSLLLNSTRSQIIVAFEEINQRIKKTDNLLVFFAGHGHYNPNTKNGYWIPADGKKSSSANWLRNSTIKDYISTINCRHILLIADACFTGSIFKTRGTYSKSTYINKAYELPSRKAMTSGNLNAVPDNSVFMRYLLKRLKSNSQKYMTSMQLYQSILDAVMNNSDTLPQYGTIHSSGDEGGNFVFIQKEVINLR